MHVKKVSSKLTPSPAPTDAASLAVAVREVHGERESEAERARVQAGKVLTATLDLGTGNKGVCPMRCI